jgi:hypothetical protein
MHFVMNHIYLAHSFPQLMCPDSDMVIARWLHHLESNFYDDT